MTVSSITDLCANVIFSFFNDSIHPILSHIAYEIPMDTARFSI